MVKGHSIKCNIIKNESSYPTCFPAHFGATRFINGSLNTQNWIGRREEMRAISELPVKNWVPLIEEQYEARVKRHEGVGDDALPFEPFYTG